MIYYVMWCKCMGKVYIECTVIRHLPWILTALLVNLWRTGQLDMSHQLINV